MTDYRDATKPFYIVVIECQPGRIELNNGVPLDFDVEADARAYLKREQEEFGCGGHVYLCTPKFSLPTVDEAGNPVTLEEAVDELIEEAARA